MTRIDEIRKNFRLPTPDAGHLVRIVCAIFKRMNDIGKSAHLSQYLGENAQHSRTSKEVKGHGVLSSQSTL